MTTYEEIRRERIERIMRPIDADTIPIRRRRTDGRMSGALTPASSLFKV